MCQVSCGENTRLRNHSLVILGTDVARHSECLTHRRPAAHKERSQPGKGRSWVELAPEPRELGAEVIMLQEMPEHQKAEKRSVRSGGGGKGKGMCTKHIQMSMFLAGVFYVTFNFIVKYYHSVKFTFWREGVRF